MLKRKKSGRCERGEMFPRALAATLAVSLATGLLVAADAFRPDSGSTAHAANVTSGILGKDGYSSAGSVNGTSAISINADYTLGSSAHGSGGQSIKVKCLSKDGTTAVMQTYGVGAGPWPILGGINTDWATATWYSEAKSFDLEAECNTNNDEHMAKNPTISYYVSWGGLRPAISNVRLPEIKSETKDILIPEGSKAILLEALKGSLKTYTRRAWLGETKATSSGDKLENESGNPYQLNDVGNIDNGYGSDDPMIIAPFFTLDLTKVNQTSNTITYSTFADSTGIKGTQSKKTATEGESVPLDSIMTGVSYAGGTNDGRATPYTITFSAGAISGGNWIAPKGINKAQAVNITVTCKGSSSGAKGKTISGTINVSPRAAKYATAAKEAGFPDSLPCDSKGVDLSQYITVTGYDAGSESDGRITDYTLSVDEGDLLYCEIRNGKTFVPKSVSKPATVKLKVALTGKLGDVSYAGKEAQQPQALAITVVPTTEGWTERDKDTDDKGFYTWKDPKTEVTWKYRYNNDGDAIYVYTEDAAHIGNIITDGGVLLVPASINGVNVAGIGGGSKNSQSIPFIPASGNTWKSLYIPPCVEQIGDGAFAGNDAQANIVIPGTVHKIGVRAFRGSKIKSVIFNDAADLDIGQESFADIPTLKSAAFRGSGITIRARAFENAVGLEEVDIPNGTEFRGKTGEGGASGQENSYAFQGTTGLKAIKIDTDGVYNNTFTGNKNLAKVIFGENVGRVQQGWSGTKTNNASTLSETVGRKTYVLNADTVFEMAKNGGGSPFGYAGNLAVVGRRLDLNTGSPLDRYNAKGDPVTGKVHGLEQNYQSSTECETYAKGSAASITITVSDDPLSDDGDAESVQDGIEAYYSGSVFTGKALDKSKMSVYRTFGSSRGAKYGSDEFYVLRTGDADALLGETFTSVESASGGGIYVAERNEDVLNRFAEKDIITAGDDDLSAGTIDAMAIVLLKDASGKVMVEHEAEQSKGRVKAFSCTISVPVKLYTAADDFLENYGSYQSVIDKVNELQKDADELEKELANANGDRQKYEDALKQAYEALTGEENPDFEGDAMGMADKIVDAVRQLAESKAEELAKYAQENADMELAIEDIRSLLYNEEATRVSGKIAELEAAVDSLEGLEADACRMRIERLKGYSDTIDLVRKNVTGLVDAQDDVAALEEQLGELKKLAESLGQTVDGNEDLIDKLKDAIGSLQSQNAQQDGTIKELESSVQKLEELNGEQSGQIGDLYQTLFDTALDGDVDADTLRALVEKAKSKIEALKAKNTELATEIGKLTATMATLTSKNGAMAKTIEDLSAKTDELERNNGTLKSQLANLNDKLSSSQGEIEQLKKTADHLTEQNASLASEIERLKSELAAAQKKADLYDTIVDTAETLLHLNLRNADSKEKVEAAIREYVKAAATYMDDSVIDQSSNNYKAGYGDGFTKGKESAAQAGGDSQQGGDSQASGGDSQQGGSQQAGGNGDTDADGLSGKLSSLQSSYDSLSSRYSGLSDENTSLRGANETLKGENSTLKDENSSLKDENASLKAENETLRDAEEGGSDAGASLKEKNATLRSKNNSLTSKNKSLESKNKSLTSKNKSLESKNKSLATQNGKLSSNNKALAEENGNLKNRVSGLQSQVNSLQSRPAAGGSGSGSSGGTSGSANGKSGKNKNNDKDEDKDKDKDKDGISVSGSVGGSGDENASADDSGSTSGGGTANSGTSSGSAGGSQAGYGSQPGGGGYGGLGSDDSGLGVYDPQEETYEDELLGSDAPSEIPDNVEGHEYQITAIPELESDAGADPAPFDDAIDYADGLHIRVNDGIVVNDTAEEKAHADAIFSYYANHMDELGEHAGVDELAGMGYGLKEEVSFDLLPSNEEIEMESEGLPVHVEVGYDGMVDGRLYAIVHESMTSDAYDVMVARATDGWLSFELDDLSPISIAEVTETAGVAPGDADAAKEGGAAKLVKQALILLAVALAALGLVIARKKRYHGGHLRRARLYKG